MHTWHIAACSPPLHSSHGQSSWLPLKILYTLVYCLHTKKPPKLSNLIDDKQIPQGESMGIVSWCYRFPVKLVQVTTQHLHSCIILSSSANLYGTFIWSFVYFMLINHTGQFSKIMAYTSSCLTREQQFWEPDDNLQTIQGFRVKCGYFVNLLSQNIWIPGNLKHIRMHKTYRERNKHTGRETNWFLYRNQSFFLRNSVKFLR